MLPKSILSLCSIVFVAGLSFQAVAEQDHHPRNNYDCPDDYFGQTYVMANGTVVEDPDRTIDEEFGAGSEAITHCLSHRKHAKVLVAINGAHPQDKNGIAQTQRARFLSNIEYMRENYEVMHDMKIGKDVKVIAVASNSGALLMTTYHPAWMRDSDDGSTDCPMRPLAGKTCANPFRELVERAQGYGVKFYLCQMASRVLGIKKGNKIDGVTFVPGGHIAVADFQMDGYALIDL